MSVKDIEQAITELPASEVAELLRWLEEYQAASWDNQIERDAKAGKFDALIAQAKAEHKAGRTRPL